jgi:hypothetical protein
MRNVVFDSEIEGCAVRPRLAAGYDGDFSQAGHNSAAVWLWSGLLLQGLQRTIA